MSKKIGFDDVKELVADIAGATTAVPDAPGSFEVAEETFYDMIPKHGEGLTREGYDQATRYRQRYTAASGFVAVEKGQAYLAANHDVPKAQLVARMAPGGADYITHTVLRKAERVSASTGNYEVHGSLATVVRVNTPGLDEVRAHALAEGAKLLAGK
jgi:hypothetical protein